MKSQAGKFTFSVPEGHPEAGKKIEKAFEYQVCETPDEANAVIIGKKWDVMSMVNDNLKANARSNAYQAALLPYRPSEVSADDIRERMIRDFIRLGVSEEIARVQVASLLADQAQPASA